MKPVRAIVFDLDGTLVDTFDICLQGTQHVLRQFVPHPVPDEELIPLYGMPMAQIMARYSPREAEAMVVAFEAFYRQHQEALVRPFPGVVETLCALNARGYLLAILSNKRKVPGLREVRIFEFADLFGSVLFLEDLARPKPAAEALLQSARELDVAPGEVLYVGDSCLDVRCARAAGAASAAALWSRGSLQELLAEGPDHVLGSVEELLELCPLREDK